MIAGHVELGSLLSQVLDLTEHSATVASNLDGAPLSAFASLETPLAGAQAAQGLDAMATGTLAVLRAVENGPLTAWRTWRRIALADGGWVRVMPMRQKLDWFFVHVAGPWAEKAGCAGSHALRAGQLVDGVARILAQLESARAGLTKGDLGAVLRELHLDNHPLAGRISLVDAARPAVSLEIAPNVCMTVELGEAGGAPWNANLQLHIGPMTWRGESLNADEIGRSINAVRSAVMTRIQIDQQFQQRPDRAQRLLSAIKLSPAAQDAARAGLQLLWVSPATVEFVADEAMDVQISLPTMGLLPAFALQMREMPTRCFGLTRQGSSASTSDMRGAPYSAAVATNRGPFITQVSMSVLAESLA